MATRVLKWPDKGGKDDHGRDGGEGGDESKQPTVNVTVNNSPPSAEPGLGDADQRTLVNRVNAAGGPGGRGPSRPSQGALDRAYGHRPPVKAPPKTAAEQASIDAMNASLRRKKKPKKSLDLEAGMFTKQGCRFFKVDDEHGIAFGWAIISTINGQPYFDTQGDHIPMSAVYKAAERFMKNSRAGDEQHDERRAGDVPFCMPVDVSLAKSLFGADLAQEGLVIGFKPYDKKLLSKIKRGERRGFSIGGTLARYTTKSRASFGKRVAFAKGFTDTQGERRVFEDFEIDFISSVDWPAQEGALVTIVKSRDSDDGDEENVLWMRKDIMPPKKPAPPMGANPMVPPQQMGSPMNPMGNMPMGMPPPANPMSSAVGGSLGVPAPKLTGESDGHQHAILLEDVGENGVGYTGFGISSTGVSHRHAFVVHPDGTTEIAVNDGHTHNADGTSSDVEVDPETGEPIEPELDEDGNPVEPELDELGNPVDPDGGEFEDDEGPEFGTGDMGATDDGEEETDEEPAPKKPGRGAPPFAPRKRGARSAGQNGEPGLASVTKEHAMDPLKQIAALKKQLADAQAIGELTDAEKAYYKSLSPRDQPAFLEASTADRTALVEKARDQDEVLYKCDDGTEIRKSDGELVARMARRNDELSNKYAKQAEKTEQLEFEKRATSIMKSYPKTPAVKAVILKAIEKATESVGKDGKLVVDDTLRKECLEVIAAGDKALSKRFGRYGKSVQESADEVDSDDPEGKLETLAKKLAKEEKISFHKAYEQVLKTEEGEELYAEIAGGTRAVDTGELDEYEDDDGEYEVVEEA